MDNKLKLLTRSTLLTICLTLIVIGLGAYTRLKDAGLGCPDWPGCYGHLLVTSSTKKIEAAKVNYQTQSLLTTKAWIEMVHRYAAGLLGIMILFIAGLCVSLISKYDLKFLLLGMSLLALVIYQAILGMWTVTLKLWPVVVTSHLLGGMIILGLLSLLYLKAKNQQKQLINQNEVDRLKPWVFFGLVFIFIQMALGAWTSTNYAALSCPDFPFCIMNGNWHYQFREAFNILSPLGLNYEGGILNNAARMTIQMVHRLGAAIVTMYLLILIAVINIKYRQFQRLKRSSYLLFLLLAVQLILGMLNIILKLPLTIAIAHNLVAALLFVTMIVLNFQVFSKYLSSKV